MNLEALFHVLEFLSVLALFAWGPIILVVLYWADWTFSTGRWAVFIVVLLLAGLFTRLTVVSVLASLVLIAIIAAWFWHRVILADVRYSRTFTRTHIFPDEETEVLWTIVNDKPLPVSWLRWEESIEVKPFGLAMERGIEFDGVQVTAISDGNGFGIDEITSLAGFQTLEKTARVKGLKRGYYRFGPIHWRASDVLGLYTAERVDDDVAALTVYPAIYSLTELGLPIDAVLGDVRQRSLVDDPSWYRGPREYRPSDPMKTIDWKTSARTGSLFVKTFEPTVHPKLIVVANLLGFERIADGLVTERTEDVISVTGSICKWALDAGFEVGVHSNGALPETHIPAHIPPSAEDHQLLAILDYLARIILIVSRRIEEILEADLASTSQGTAIVVVSSVVTPGLSVALSSLARRRRVLLVLTEGRTPVSIPGVSVTTVVVGARAA